MLERIVQYFDAPEFQLPNLSDFIRSNVVYATVLAACVGFFLKYAIRRRNHMRDFPSRKVALLNVLGNLDVYKNSARMKEVPFEIHAIQVLFGYHELFKKENFFYIGMSYIPFLVITKAKAFEEFISGAKNSQKSWLYDWLHPWIGTGLLTSHGSKWKSRRKLLTPAFHFDILKEFLPIFNEQSRILVNLLEKETKQPWIDVRNPITLCSLDIICETILGASVGAQKNSESEYVQAVTRVTRSIAKRLINPLYYVDWFYHLTSVGCQFKKDIKLLHNFTRTVIKDKKRKLLRAPREAKDSSDRKRKALMDLLLEEHIKDETFTEEDIREEVDTFTFEGHDTTSVAMIWALYLIGLYRDVQEQIIEEIDRIFGDDIERPVTTDDLKYAEYLDRVLKESLRLYPSVPIFGRRLSEDIEICGVKVPKDMDIAILSYGIHRDESVYPNPEKFDPDRFLPENSATRSPFAYVPFSAGPRNCIGQRFAMMEEKVVIINVLRNFRIESLDPRDKVMGGAELIFRSPAPVRIKLAARRRSTS